MKKRWTSASQAHKGRGCQALTAYRDICSLKGINWKQASIGLTQYGILCSRCFVLLRCELELVDMNRR